MFFPNVFLLQKKRLVSDETTNINEQQDEIDEGWGVVRTNQEGFQFN